MSITDSIRLEFRSPVTRTQAAAALMAENLDSICSCPVDADGFKSFALVATQDTERFGPREIYRHSPCGAMANIPWD